MYCLRSANVLVLRFGSIFEWQIARQICSIDFLFSAAAFQTDVSRKSLRFYQLVNSTLSAPLCFMATKDATSINESLFARKSLLSTKRDEESLLLLLRQKAIELFFSDAWLMHAKWKFASLISSTLSNIAGCENIDNEKLHWMWRCKISNV